MKKILTNATVYHESGIIDCGFLLIENDQIVQVGPMINLPSVDAEIIDVQGHTVLPGFIDLQVNGAGGFLATEDNGEHIPNIQKTLAKYGTTSFLVATSPCSDKEHIELLKTISSIMNKKTYGATVLGAHMEGPFLNPQKSGANDPNFVSLPDEKKFLQFLEPGSLRLMTISPEIGDFHSIIKTAKEHNVVLSMGHSTASYDEACYAFEAGISSATHLFNTMNGITARDPGIVGAVTEKKKYCTLIADGAHVHPFNINMLYKCIGSDQLILITDSAPTAGTTQKEWDFGGMKIYVNGYTCYSEKGNIMGSSLTMNKAASVAKKYMHCTTREIVKMCSENPAKCIHVFDKKGSISKGKDADIVVIKDENTFEIEKVFVMGKEYKE